VGHRQDESSHRVACIDNYGEIGNTSEGFASRFSFVEVFVGYIDILLFSALASRSALDRDTHYFPRVGVTRYDIYSSMVHKSTLKSILREPVENDGLPEVPCNFCMSCALFDLHYVCPILELTGAR